MTAPAAGGRRFGVVPAFRLRLVPDPAGPALDDLLSRAAPGAEEPAEEAAPRRPAADLTLRHLNDGLGMDWDALAGALSRGPR